MQVGGDEVVKLNGEGTPDSLEARYRSTDEARTEVERRLWFASMGTVIFALGAFILGSWILAILGGLGAFGVLRLVGELREPQRYLQVPRRQLVGRILESRESWEALEEDPRDSDQLLKLQDLLDDLSLGESWLSRNDARITIWVERAATAIWLALALFALVNGGDVWVSLLLLAPALPFGAIAVRSARYESDRQEAVEILEGVREGLASRSSTLPAKLDQEIEKAEQEKRG